MANALLKAPYQGYEHKPHVVHVRIFPNGASAPTWSSNGGIASVSRSAAGKFLVTFEHSYQALAVAQLTAHLTSDVVDSVAQGGDVSNLGTSSAATAVVKIKAGTSNTDLTADPDNWIGCTYVFEDSDIGPVTG